jgi:hypothetical protein
VISAAENSNKFQETRFWKEKSVEDMVTLGAKGTCHTSLSMKEGSLFVLFVLMRPTEPGCFKLRSWSIWTALNKDGVHGLGSMTIGLGVQKF